MVLLIVSYWIGGIEFLTRKRFQQQLGYSYYGQHEPKVPVQH